MRLLLVRHAEARREGLEDFGLTPAGQAQAEAVSETMRREGQLEELDRLLSSPSPRALATAGVIARGISISVEVADSLCEMGETQIASGGSEETFPRFLERISACLDELAELHAGETVLAVTHSGVIVASVLTRFDIPRPGTGARLEPGYCSLTEWVAEENCWTLVRFNDVRATAF